MKKVVNITIGGVVFSVEEDAYTALSEYLHTVREHFKDSDEQEEIVDDIELGIAEKLSARKKHAVVRSADVAAIIAQMGTVAEFAQLSDREETNEEKTSDTAAADGKPRKKLYRNVDDQIIAGVASGLAAYFGLDPVLVRVLFVLSIFLNGFGILAYVVLWVVMPAAKTVTQKLEMQGDPVTLQQFEKMVKDKITPSPATTASPFMRALRVPFSILRSVVHALGRALSAVVPVARIVLGVVILIPSILVAVALSVAVTGAHFSITSGLFELPVREFLTSTEYFVGLISLYALAIIPAVFGVLLGAALLRKTGKYTGVLVLVLTIVWFAALSGVGHIATKVVPQYQTYYANMPEVVQEHDLDAFAKVALYSPDTVTITRGDAYSVSFVGKEKSVARRTFTVSGDTLTINNEKNHVCIGCFNQPVEVVITTPTLEALDVAHSAHVVTDSFEAESFSVRAQYASEVVLNVVTEKLEAYVTHSSKLTTIGSADELRAQVKYASYLDTSRLENTRTSLDAQYASSADIGATQVFNVTAGYASDVRYDGDPEVTQDTSESSTVRKKF